MLDCKSQYKIFLQLNRNNRRLIDESEMEEIPDEGIDNIQITIPRKEKLRKQRTTEYDSDIFRLGEMN